MTTFDFELPEEESRINLKFPKGETLTIDTMELHILILDCVASMKEEPTNMAVIDSVRAEFKKLYNRDISRSQMNRLMKFVQEEAIPDLKKSSSESQEFVDITEQTSPSTEEESNS